MKSVILLTKFGSMSDIKILLKTCLWSGVATELKSVGYDVVWVGDFEKDPGDVAIIRIAFQEKRVLITLDKDFGELAIFRGEPHCGIIRIVDHSVRELGDVCNQLLKKHKSDLLFAAIITVDKTKVRIRL